MSRLALVPTALATLCLLLAGCTGDEAGSAGPDRPDRPLQAPVVDYVALGDSYSAGPLVATVRSDPTECGRSTENYPAFLADWLDVRSYRDVTCSGASTRHLARAQDVFGVRRVPPQLDALSRGTDLVTVGLGGNDFRIFGTLSGCARSGEDACGVDLAALARDAERVRGRLARGLAQVTHRAPRAEVYVVGYPRVLPPAGSCPAAGLSAESAAGATEVQQRLNSSLEAAADAAGATYVDLWEASLGHDVCAGEDAWVNGVRMRPGEAAPVHPFLSGMRGAAAQAYRAITGGQPPDGAHASPDPDAVVRNDVPR